MRRAPPVGERVTLLLLGAIVLMSLGDLVMTLEIVTRLGMVEVNPVARALMSQGSPAPVIAWKLLTAGIACTILYTMRRSRTAQLGAWVGFLVLAALTVYWGLFVEELSTHQSIEDWAVSATDARWVAMVP